MASDNFTDTNGTGLEVHDSNWTSIDATYPVTNLEIQNNQVQADAAWRNFGAYYSASSEDACEMVLKAQSGTFVNRNVAVRAGASQRGYSTILSVVSGGNYTTIYANKNGSFLATIATGQNIPTNADHTVKITATGTSTVTLEVFLDGVSKGTTNDSSSPLGSGSPGFWSPGHGVPGDYAFDNWTDGATGGGAVPVMMSNYLRMMGA